MIEQLRAYVAQGLSDPAIGRICGVSRSTIARARKALEIPGVGKPGRRRQSDRGKPKPHRPEEQPYRVRLLDDESVWLSVLAGKRYDDAVTADGGAFRRSPALATTGECSMAWAG